MDQGGPATQTGTLLGAVLGDRYRIERMLGHGGMGMVYLAVHVRTGRRCAVKLLPPEASQDPEAVQRFEREAQVLGALGHPGIVGIHDFSETPDGRPYFVMDYLEGEDLATRMQRLGRLSWADTQKIVDEICAALFAAHQAGVLHRDLKPANVFLARSPASPERVVLLDFGLAKGGTTDGLSLTRSNMVMGTPLYMSPEQARCVGVDARSDVYSLATMVYELLSGTPPFIGPNYTAVLASVLTDPPRKLSDSAQVAVPAHLDLALDIALSKSPEDRHPDVASFATAVLQRRPRWVDTTARGMAVVATVPAEEGVTTGPPATSPGVRGSSLEMAGTVASNPDLGANADGDVDVQTAATVASDVVDAAVARTLASQPPASAPMESRAPSVETAVQPTPPPVAVQPAPPPVAVQPAPPPVAVQPAPPPVAVQPAPPPADQPVSADKRSRLVPVLVVVSVVGVGIGIAGAVAYYLSQRRQPSPSRSEAQASSTKALDAATSEQPRVPPDATVTAALNPPINVDKAGEPAGGGVAPPQNPTRPRARTRPQARPRPRPRPRERPMTAVPSAGPMSQENPNKLSGFRLLSKLYMARKYRPCARLAKRLQPSRAVLNLGVACATNLGDMRALRYFCRTSDKHHPGATFSRRCRANLQRLQRALNKKRQRQGGH